MALPEQDDRITPVEELFTYHIFGVPDQVRQYQEDASSYELTIGGLVDQELHLSLEEIRDGFDQVSGVMILQCMTDVHWGRLRFTGARLLEVLERAGIGDDAYKAAVKAAEGFDTNLRLEEIRERPDAFLLAHSMNDEPLTVDHGFPLRLTADGKYGYKWLKWVTVIDVVAEDYRGHYEGKRGWSDEAIRGQRVT